jgi:small subunit ribosomal protein S6
LKTYEAVFILDERQFTDGGEAFAEDIVQRVEKSGGRVLRKDPMGRRQFARPIRKQKAGIYWDFVLEMDPDQVAPLKEAFRLDESVFRAVVFLYEGPELD